MRNWHINVILISLVILITGMFYTIHLLWSQKANQHEIIKSALVEALDETYDVAAE